MVVTMEGLELDPAVLRNEFRLELGWALGAGVSKRAIRREFGCSKQTLSRWTEGLGAPHPAMLPPFTAALRRMRIEAKEAGDPRK